MTNSNPFEQFLQQQDEEAWAGALTTLLRAVHEVDKNATQIWFSFYPLALARALETSADPQKLAAQLLMQGDYQLKDQIDSSHRFLYGHRYWPSVKKAIDGRVANFSPAAGAKLSDEILKVARAVAQQEKVNESLTTGITAVGFMTARQAGLAAFQSAKGEMLLDRGHAKKSPEQVLRDFGV